MLFLFTEQLSVSFVLSNMYFDVRIVINPEKRPYNMSEVILWTLDSGNTANTLEMNNDNEECYYFERLEKVLATQVSYQILLYAKLQIRSFLTKGYGKTTLESCQDEAEV